MLATNNEASLTAHKNNCRLPLHYGTIASGYEEWEMRQREKWRFGVEVGAHDQQLSNTPRNTSTNQKVP
uniref:Uncharacterized protein n=1 Tax=Parascaris equorum TaxID=6256 RepID=A0A914RP59_PAREQ